MELLRIAQMKTRISFVVCLKDSFTSEAPIGNQITVYVEGIRSKPIVKPNGSYIFSDLPEGQYRLHVQAEHYFAESIDFLAGTSNSVEYVSLLPLPSYPFKQGDTLMRMVLKDDKGLPIQDAHLSATVQTEDCVRARLAQDKAEKGADEITVSALTGKMGVGDRFMIQGRSAKAGEESLQIVQVLEYNKRFRLDQPLTRSYSRGSLLLPIVQARSTQRGEVVLAFAGCRIKNFQIELKIAYGAHGEHTLLKEVMAEEGTSNNLGTLCVAP
jgi:hypothetical protein